MSKPTADNKKPMSNSERQQKHCSVHLEDMAGYLGFSKRKLIEKLVMEKYKELISTDKYNRYLDELM